MGIGYQEEEEKCQVQWVFEENREYDVKFRMKKGKERVMLIDIESKEAIEDRISLRATASNCFG